MAAVGKAFSALGEDKVASMVLSRIRTNWVDKTDDSADVASPGCGDNQPHSESRNGCHHCVEIAFSVPEHLDGLFGCGFTWLKVTGDTEAWNYRSLVFGVDLRYEAATNSTGRIIHGKPASAISGHPDIPCFLLLDDPANEQLPSIGLGAHRVLILDWRIFNAGCWQLKFSQNLLSLSDIFFLVY
jgi:hypothetical protein